jgi:hypothetical protein
MDPSALISAAKALIGAPVPFPSVVGDEHGFNKGLGLNGIAGRGKRSCVAGSDNQGVTRGIHGNAARLGI